MPDKIMEVKAVRDVPEIGSLYLAARTGDPARRFEFIDAVDPGIPRAEKWVIMISTQSGCAVGCRMCDAGDSGYRGNLTSREMLGQIRVALSAHPETRPAAVRKLKIHFARMGEPTLNPAVLACIEHLAKTGDMPGLLPSVSTVAPRCAVSTDFLKTLRGLKDRYFSGGRFQLQFSIHSTDREARRALIPIRKWSLEEIAAFGGEWRRPGDRLITLNFALADKVPFDSRVLKKIFSPERFLVKFTPVHPTGRADRNGLTRVWYDSTRRIEGLKSELGAAGFRVIVNPSHPAEVAGGVSCGQLAASVERAEEKTVVEAVGC